jgi:lipopolysaccharide/colanic/teichoic acid biosynthesis glycosyltransferase
LLGRQDVTPGITGLWQVEGRDNPEFEVYRRLDLFYVENWSVGLDLAIMLGTAQAVLGRLLQLPRRNRDARSAVDLTVLTGESAAGS